MNVEEVKNYFRIGQLYTRKEIHAKFGGNPRSGFSVSKNYPAIFVFTSAEGRQYGYKDGWMADGFLHIAGEGQQGDMKFTRGNKAIREHIKDGKILLYFEGAANNKRKYVGGIKLYDYYKEQLPDKKRNLRNGIMFRFQSIDAIKADEEQQTFEARIHKEGAERRVVMTQKERSPALRSEALSKYGRCCMVCGFDFDKFYGKDIAKGYIEVHHEKMLSGVEGEREITVEEVKVVCSNCHRMIHRKREMLDWGVLKKKIKNE